MITIKDTLAGERIWLYCVESTSDLLEVRDFIRDSFWLGFDTESTNINCYRPDWRLRTAQWGNRNVSYVVPARYKKFISWAMDQPVRLIGHNGPHDVRSIDVHLGRQTGVVCAGETSATSRLADSRNRSEGGIGHGLKEQSCAIVDPTADRWEKQLKAKFKEILIPMRGEVYKSGPKKGTQKYRKARLAEGWGLIDPMDPTYIAYAAVDPILTFWVWEHYQSLLQDGSQLKLYRFDKRLAVACSELQRRAMALDIPYTIKLSDAYQRKIDRTQRRIKQQFDVDNVNSTAQIADCLIDLGVKLTKKTETGKWAVKAEILRTLLKDKRVPREAKEFINLVLVAKQVAKRRAAYTEAMLREVDANGRVHPAINSNAARTSRMSVSNPAFQQLPVKDHESELDWELEDEVEEVLEEAFQ